MSCSISQTNPWGNSSLTLADSIKSSSMVAQRSSWIPIRLERRRIIGRSSPLQLTPFRKSSSMLTLACWRRGLPNGQKERKSMLTAYILVLLIPKCLEQLWTTPVMHSWRPWELAWSRRRSPRTLQCGLLCCLLVAHLASFGTVGKSSAT